jgi:FlaA1/EpsC-like NDP-sugar epimerase
MGSAGITNVGPINTPTTNQGAIAGFDPIMKMHKRRTKKRKKMESAGKQWDHRRRDPTYIDGRSKQARNLIKRLSKKKKMTEAVIHEEDEKKTGGDNTSQAYKFIAQKRKVLKKQEREKRAQNRKQEIQTISRAKASDYQSKAKDRQKKLSTQLATKKEEWDGIVYMESLLEQLENENENPIYYFFNDESELEVTNEQAYDIVEKFGSLSDENKEIFLDKIAESKNFLSHIIRL